MPIIGQQMPVITSEAGQAGVIGSSSALALPLVEGANHILGHKLMGLLHAQVCDTPREGKGRFYTYRHPNCDTLLAVFKLEGISEVTSGQKIELKAGTGTTVTVEVYTDGYAEAAFDWGGSDTGNCEVTYETFDCDLKCISIWAVRRPFLDPSTEMVVGKRDATYAMARMQEGGYIIYSDANNNIADLAKQIKNARDYTLRHAVSWSGVGATKSCSSSSWVAPFGGFTWRHIARKLRSGDTSRDYVVYARTYFDGSGGDTYDWRVTSNGGSSTVTGLTRTTADWDNQGSDYLEVSCASIDDLEFEMRYSSGSTPTCHVADLSIYERGQ